MPKRRVGFYLYLGAVIATGWFGFVWLTVHNLPSVELVPVILFWCLLAVVVEFFPVPLPRGGFVTLGFPVVFASLLLWGPLVGSWAAVGGAVLGVGLRMRLKPYQIAFDSAQLVVTIIVGASVFVYSGGTFLYAGSIGRFHIVPIVSAVIAYFLTNSFAVSTALALQQRVSPWEMWSANCKGASPNYLAQAPLAVLMVLIYRVIGWWGLVFVLMPIYVGYHVFKLYSDIHRKHLSIIRVLAAAIEKRDSYTEEHSQRMADYAVVTARALRIPVEALETIRNAAILHDVGKIGITDQVLSKVGPLTEDEREAIKQHSRIGADILGEIDALGDIARLLYHHHERYDGAGYPDGLHGQAIPLGARIISVIDAYDAMTSHRPYRPALSQEQAIAELKKGNGTQFDEQVVTAFLKVLRDAV